MGSYPYPRNGILKIDYEFILIFKKHGIAQKVSKDKKDKSKLTKEEWNQYFSGHWNFPGEKKSKHLAVFPSELPIRIIKWLISPFRKILKPGIFLSHNLLRNYKNIPNHIDIIDIKYFDNL